MDDVTRKCAIYEEGLRGLARYSRHCNKPDGWRPCMDGKLLDCWKEDNPAMFVVLIVVCIIVFFICCIYNSNNGRGSYGVGSGGGDGGGWGGGGGFGGGDGGGGDGGGC